MNKILPITTPIIDCYPDMANMFSVLNCYDLPKKWILNNFIQIVYRRDEKNSFGSFLDLMRTGNDITIYQHCPYLDVNLMDKSFERNIFGDIFQFIQFCLKNNYYIQMYINKKYISAAEDINFDFMHEVFVYGIDQDNSIIYLSDFYRGKYKRILCPFEEFENAYLNSFKDNVYYRSAIYFDYPHMVKYNMDKIILFKYVAHELYDSDYSRVRRQICDYIECKNSQNDIENSYIASGYRFYYGLDFYDQLILDIKEREFDIRKPYVLLSHKRILRLVIKEMENVGNISQDNEKMLQLKLDALILSFEKIYRRYVKISLKREVKEKEVIDLCNYYAKLKELDWMFMKDVVDIL